MASLRSLLNIKDATELNGYSQPAEGQQHLFAVTCYLTTNDSYSDFCCMSFIVEAGASRATFDVWGGGGSGAVACCCMWGVPGGSGAYTRKYTCIEPGQCYAIILGRSAYCSNGTTGCNGCWSCVCGADLCYTPYRLTLCAQGGEGGCSCCNLPCCGMYRTGGEDVGGERYSGCAFGGDWNIPAVKGCLWHRCYNNGCYNKYFIAYPGGIINRCGGVVMSRPHDSRWYSGWASCMASYIGANIGGGIRWHGYLPGVGGGSAQICGGGCICGTAGTPGLVRVTWT